MAKRDAYEAQFKLKAISYAEEHGNRAAAREFKINESMVRKWRKLENKLKQVKKTQLSFRGHKARWPELEERLERWIIEQRTSGASVSTVTVRRKAVTLAEEMKIEHFQGGPSWCFRFMKRCHFSIRTRNTVAQQRPVDYNEKLTSFHSYCSQHIADKLFQPSHITNMEEVPLTFDIPVNHTVEMKGTSTVAMHTTGYEHRNQVCSTPVKDSAPPPGPSVNESPDHDRENTDDAFKSRRCSVVGCDSWHRGAQCFSLPADPDTRLEWVQFLFVVNGQRIQESSWVDIRVCAEHFTPSCFVQVNPATSIALLNTDAVPSVYRPAEPEVKEMTSADEIAPVLKKVQMMDESSEPDQHRDSDDNWEPEDESLILDSDDNWEPEDESLILDSDEDYISSDEDTDDSAPKHKELCTECGKLFKTRRPHICDYKIKPFPCNICGKRCVSEQALAIHSNIHNPNHQFLCKFCLAGFKTKTNKNNHEQIHSGEERPYKCPHCSEMFDTFKNRQVHMKDHPEQGLLKCHICGMEFSYFNVFQRHLLVHTREKPFKCSVCDRGFNQSGHLKSHMRMHTGERPYKCQHCNRGFNHNVSLKSHLKRFHTESENQKKTANLGGSVGGDPEGERGTDSLNDIVEEDHAVKDVWTGGGGFKKRTTGRPIGRPKKKIKDTTVEEEKQQRQDKNTDTAKRRNRKPRKRQYSSEDDEEELCEIE